METAIHKQRGMPRVFDTNLMLVLVFPGTVMLTKCIVR